MKVEPSVALEKLAGMSSDEIAKYFEDEGIRGLRQAANYCPVANYVRRETGTALESVSVVSTSTAVADVDSVEPFTYAHRYRKIISAVNPPSVRDFVRGFDEGKYPQLFEKED